jgi:glycerophosphoryl diester phosphodiesterase
MTFFDTTRPRVFAHRGASGTHPENTMPAFGAGIAAGATHLELDVHATRDGRIVVLHDALLDRTTDACGPVSALSAAELVTVDAGYGFRDSSGARPFAGRGIRVPLLEELLSELPAVPLNVEIKQSAPAIEDEVVALLHRYDASARVLLAAEHLDLMERIRRCHRGATGFAAEEALEFHRRLHGEGWQGYSPAGRALQVPPTFEGIDVVTADLVEAAHRFDLEVHVWTINDAPSARRLLRLGVDGIMSDDPAMVVEVVSDG